jgi:hypothetical protein
VISGGFLKLESLTFFETPSPNEIVRGKSWCEAKRQKATTNLPLDGNWAYTYDDIGKLINMLYAAVTTNVPSHNLTNVYDSVVNRTQTIKNGVTNSYTANNLNQYFSVGQTNYTVDADGNLTKEMSPLALQPDFVEAAQLLRTWQGPQ